MGVQKSIETGLLTEFRDLCQSYWDWLASYFQLEKKAADKVSERLSTDSPVLEAPVNASSYYPGREGNNPLAGDGLVVSTLQVSRGFLTVDEDEITEDDVTAARRKMRRIAQKLVSALSRNRRRTEVQKQIDFRRTIRRSIQTGGIMIDVKYRARTLKKPRLVIILDTSGSMQVWIKMLVQLIQAVGLELSRREIFIFAQDLECVTKDLGRTWRDTVNALELRDNWGGTTSLYHALRTLQNDHHDKFSPQSVVLILSDLYTVEPEKAADEVRKLYRKTKAIYIFRVKDREKDDITYFQTYIQPFIGTATGLYDISSLEDMAEAIRKVVVS